MPTIILGDFNDDLLSTSTSSRLLQFMSSKGFSQLVQGPTTDSGSLLDHIYCNDVGEDTCYVDVIDTYYSDHDATYLSLLMQSPTSAGKYIIILLIEHYNHAWYLQ